MQEDEEIARFYTQGYSALDSGSVGVVMSAVHKSLENGLAGKMFARTLELGAGQGQHFGHVRHKFDEYHETDIRHNETETNERSNAMPLRYVLDAQDLDSLDGNFDRVLATCLLMHLEQPDRALRGIRQILVIRPGGQVDLYLPMEGSLALLIGRALFTAPKVKRQAPDLDYKRVLSLEHRYRVSYLLQLVRDHFPEGDFKVATRNWPVRFFPRFLSLWMTIRITRIRETPLTEQPR